MVSKRKSSRKLTWKRKLLFSAVLLFFSFFLLESGLRVFLAFRVGPRVMLYGTRFHRNKSAPKEHHTVMEHGNTRSGYTKYFPHEAKVDHNPETGEFFSVTINSRGFRGAEFTEEKPPGVIRVVTLGASSTFGYYDKDNETYPYYLQQRLNEAAKSGTSFEVINLGIPHLRSEQILSLLREEALPLNPDVVTFYEGINDSAYRPRANTIGNKIAKTLKGVSWLTSLYRASRDRLITVAIVDSFRQATYNYNKEYLEKHIKGRREDFVKNIAALNSECRKRGIVFIVANQQAKSLALEDLAGVTYADEVEIVEQKLSQEGNVSFCEFAFLTHNVLTNDVESWARSNDVPFVDIIESLDRNREVLLSWVHLSPTGNQMIAGALAREIERQILR